MPNKAFFLDRDGTINEDRGYISDISGIYIYPRSIKALKLIQEKGYMIIVVTNQAGVAMGYMTEKRVKEINKYMINELLKENIKIDALYYCPYHPKHGNKKYRRGSFLRKPEPGMIIKASQDFKIDLKNSYMIGDKISDIEAGRKAGCKTVLVRTGFGEKSLEDLRFIEASPDYISEDLYDAVKNIFKREKRSPR